MKNFVLECYSSLPPEEIFNISIDVENFHHTMPDYFESLNIIKKNDREIIVDEIIKFLGFKLKVQTKHVIKKPNIHEVHILTGPAKGTSFIESYIQSSNGTLISINVTLQFSGIMKLLSIFENLVAKKMHSTMKEFVMSAETFYSSKIQSS